MSRSKQLKRDRSRLSPLQGIKTGDYPLRGTSAGNESFLSYLLYAFEINVRASTILGYIGAEESVSFATIIESISLRPNGNYRFGDFYRCSSYRYHQ